MTQEEKQLLLIDLCARLPYGVKVRHITESAKEVGASYLIDVLNPILYKYILEDNILAWPYLRQMSSMTEEEYNEIIFKFDCEYTTYTDGYKYSVKFYTYSLESIEWLNVHHFDYRGLIEKGLAIEAPKEMYE